MAMDKHWARLMINQPARHYGRKIYSKAHSDTKISDQQKRESEHRRNCEMGQAFCDRATINLTDF